MAITRTTTTEVASVDINDLGGVQLTLRRAREAVTVDLTSDEAYQLAREISDAVMEADSINHEGDEA